MVLPRATFWRLTVHFWPSAAEHRVQPVVAQGFSEGHQYYQPHEINFNHPPSREDFLHVVDRTVWMRAAWDEGTPSLTQVLAYSPWPMIDEAHKAATVDLKFQGMPIGRLEVRKEDRWENNYRPVPFLHIQFLRKVTARCKDKEGAYQYLELHLQAIMERIAKIEGWTEDTCRRECRKVLVEGWFLKKA